MALARAVRAAGGRPLVQPLMRAVELASPVPPEAAAADVLLLSSARAARLLGARAEAAAFRRLPAWCVGPQTALAARRAGFAVARVGRAGVAELLAGPEACGRTLLAPGHARPTRVDPPPGTRLVRLPLYDMEPAAALRPTVARHLAGGRVAVVLLLSAEAAHIFGRLVDAAGHARAGLSLAVLGPAVASAAGPGWRRVVVSGAPRLPSLLACARRLWQ